MLELNIIKEAKSNFTFPMRLVEAPGKYFHHCIDYRKFNTITKSEFLPLPNIDETVDKVAAAKYITVFVLNKGYREISMIRRNQKLAAFVTSFGTFFLPISMPFGLVRFSKFLAKLLSGLEEYGLPYLVDMAFFSDNWEKRYGREHL